MDLRSFGLRSVVIAGECLFHITGFRQRAKESPIPEPARILVIRTDEIGDFLLSTPFLRELRRGCPTAAITLVVKSNVRSLAEHCPYVDEVLTFDVPYSAAPDRAPRNRAAAAGLWPMLRFSAAHLWKQRFDLAILPRFDVDFPYYGSFMAYFSGAPHRVGVSEKATDQKQKLNRGFDRLFTDLVEPERGARHEVERNLDVLRHLGIATRNTHLEVWLDEADKTAAREMLDSPGLGTGGSIVAFGPGARESKRRWPAGHFVELGLRLPPGTTVLLLGSPEEAELCRDVAAKIGRSAITLAGRATLRQTAAVLKRCRLFVGNDNGLMHLAAAAGVPVVEISAHPADGSADHHNSPSRFGPWGVECCVLQPKTALPPCRKECNAGHSHCITAVPVEQVEKAVNDILQTVRVNPLRDGFMANLDDLQEMAGL